MGGIGLYLSTAYFIRTKEVGIGLATSIEASLQEYLEKFGHASSFPPEISIHQIPLFNTLSGLWQLYFSCCVQSYHSSNHITWACHVDCQLSRKKVGWRSDQNFLRFLPQY